MNNTASNQNESTARLYKRGILDAAQAAQWEPWQDKSGVGGWRYPVFDLDTEQPYRSPKNGKIVYRWKNFNQETQGGEKYRWLFGQKGCPPYYVLLGTRSAIAQAGGVAYLAAGEPDVLAYRSAGIHNVFCWLNGEGSVPHDLAQIAHQLGCNHLVYFIDSDEAGYESAALTAKRLAGTNVALSAYRLPASLGEKGDINNLWLECNQDAEVFVQTLTSISAGPALGLLEQSPHAAPQSDLPLFDPLDIPLDKLSPAFSPEVDWVAEHTLWVKEEVMPCLDQKAPILRREGPIGRRQCPDPTHVDRNPSFRISYDRNKEVGIPQCSCGIQKMPRPWEVVADWVGAMSFLDWWRSQRRSSAVRSTDQTAQKAGNGHSSRDARRSVTQQPCDVSREEADPSFELSDMGNAQRLARRYGADIRYLTDRKQWLTWEGSFWDYQAHEVIMGRAKETVRAITQETQSALASDFQQVLLKHARASQNVARLNGMISLLKSEPGIAISEALLDRNPWLFACANGVIDLQTGELLPGNRDDLITKHSPVAYAPEMLADVEQNGLEASAPTFAGFLKHSTGGSEDYQMFLRNVLGYTLTGSTREEKYFLLYGPGGNGKTKLLELMAYIMGPYAIKAQFETFVRQSFETVRGHTSDIARLAAGRFVYANEGNKGRRLNVALINELTGGDRISASRKHENEFEFTPVMKLFLATNHKPVIVENTPGIWRRTLLLPFSRPVSASQQDKLLPEKLQREAPYVLAWMVSGCLSWQQGGLRIPDEVHQATEAFKQEQDSLALFLHDRCAFDEQVGHVYGSKLWQEYEKYVNRNDLQDWALKCREFYERLEQLPGVQRGTRNNQTAFYGIVLL